MNARAARGGGRRSALWAEVPPSALGGERRSAFGTRPRVGLISAARGTRRSGASSRSCACRTLEEGPLTAPQPGVLGTQRRAPRVGQASSSRPADPRASACAGRSPAAPACRGSRRRGRRRDPRLRGGLTHARRAGPIRPEDLTARGSGHRSGAEGWHRAPGGRPARTCRRRPRRPRPRRCGLRSPPSIATLGMLIFGPQSISHFGMAMTFHNIIVCVDARFTPSAPWTKRSTWPRPATDD